MRNALSLLVCLCAALVAPGVSAAHSIDWYTIDGGGGTSTGASYTCSGTIGQPDAPPLGPMTAGSYLLYGGFWTGAGGSACTGDVDADGDVDFADLLAVLSAWGPCDPCPEDVNGDGEVGFADVLIVLSAWGVCPA